MTRTLKVYGWLSERSDCPPAANGSRQVQYIVATTSWQKAVEAAGDIGRGRGAQWAGRYGSVTGNQAQIRQAMSEPGVAFWCTNTEKFHGNPMWRRVPPQKTEREGSLAYDGK